MDKIGILRCGVIQMLSIKVPFLYRIVCKMKANKMFLALCFFKTKTPTNAYSCKTKKLINKKKVNNNVY